MFLKDSDGQDWTTYLYSETESTHVIKEFKYVKGIKFWFLERTGEQGQQRELHMMMNSYLV